MRWPCISTPRSGSHLHADPPLQQIIEKEFEHYGARGFLANTSFGNGDKSVRIEDLKTVQTASETAREPEFSSGYRL